MRNEFICEIPESVREYLPRHEIEGLDLLFDDLDAGERINDGEDRELTWNDRRNSRGHRRGRQRG